MKGRSSTPPLRATAAGLRAWTHEDAAALADLYSAARREITVEEPWREEAFFTVRGQRERIERCIADDAVEGFVITEDDDLAGSLALDQIRRDVLQSADVGYWVDPRRRRRGIATTAIGLAVDHAFVELGLHRIHATVDLDNIGSWRALERNGFQRVGVIRDFAYVRGAWRDHHLYQRTAGSETAPG